MKPTEEQEECIEAFQTGGKVKISAYAGTGKTTGVEMIAKSTEKSGVYLAFNKSIADEAKRRFPVNVTCSTVHSMAFKEVVKRFPVEKMTGNISGGFVAKKFCLKGFAPNRNTFFQPRTMGWLACETVKRWMRSGKQSINGWYMPVEGKAAMLPPDELTDLRNQVGIIATQLWDEMTDPRSDIPMTHDGYLKIWAISNPKINTDFILLDEAQDTNGVVMEIVRAQDAQIVAVGDQFQNLSSVASNSWSEAP